MAFRDKEVERAYRRAYYQANKEAIKARSMAYYAANREQARANQANYYLRTRDAALARVRRWQEENREALKVSRQQRYLDNREVVATKAAARYAADPEPTKARVRAWREKNVDRRRAQARVDARRRALGKDVPTRDYGEILRRDPCSYCGGSAGAVDHIEPLKLDGANHWLNLTAVCARCNGRKATKPLLRFLSETETQTETEDNNKEQTA